MSTQSTTLVEKEIEDHKDDLTTWITGASTLSVPSSQKDVVQRFVRDCKMLQDDLTNVKRPSTHDLDDFVARRNSLEVQYLSLTDKVG